MILKQHKTCEGCAAYLPDNPDLPACSLRYDIDLIEPLQECWKPLTDVQLQIVMTLGKPTITIDSIPIAALVEARNALGDEYCSEDCGHSKNSRNMCLGVCLVKTIQWSAT